MARTDDCPRWTRCTSVCNVCPDNCDHVKVTIQTEVNEEGNTNGICNSCEATLFGNASTGWEVID
mgnify:CR=1 FL=1